MWFFVTCWRGSRCWSVFCWLCKSVVWLFSGWRFKKSAPATAAAGGEKPHYWWSSLFKQEHILWTVNDVGSQRRSLQLLRGPSRWKMPKLETWKDTSKVVMAVGSIPWGLYLGTSLMVHSVYIIMKSKNLIRTLAPCPRRHSTTSGLPASTAKCRAVYLWLVTVLTFSPLAIIALMTPTWPFWAATWIPLAPCLSKKNNS